MANEDISNHRITNVDLSKRMRSSFLDYAMSVIVSRALPDVRDGLKPVHRRILYDMHELGVTPEKPYKKSARIVGDVLGKYHPHGDSAVYQSMVRMAQPFSYRYMLVDGHGNFGSVDGDGAAAMRYTETRLSKIAVEMLRDINKNTVDFQDNYDGTEREPVVLPSRFPNLLVNGASGIAVGMATNIPPHNLGETIDAIHVLMKNPDASVMDLMKVLPGPDFPTGGIVMGEAGIKKAYSSGKGTIVLRAKTDILKHKNGRQQIIVTELPYMVNKAKLVEHIASLVREKRIDGISDIHDDSDRKGMQITIDVRRDASSKVVLNNLYKNTLMQTTFSFNMLAIVKGRPEVLSLKQILTYYLEHQVDVVRRRTQYDLTKAQNRDHILQGILVALDHIDEIVRIIRASKTGAIAKDTLLKRYPLDEKQAQAILDMRLVRLTGLERGKVEDEHKKLIDRIADLKGILASREKINNIIYNELLKIKNRYGDKRRTKLMVGEALSVEDEDLIAPQDVIVTLTHNGYVKRLPVSEFKTQNRGGRGVKGMNIHNDDFIEHLVATNTHDTLLFFTNQGKVYKMRGYEIPEYGRTAKGIPIINLLKISGNEKIQTVIHISENAKDQDKYLFFTTVNGTVKRTPVSEYQNIRSSGLKAIHLKENDELIGVSIVNAKQNVIIGTHFGYAVTFNVSDARAMGRGATGVRGIKLRKDDYVVGSAIMNPQKDVLVITEKGYGKRTPVNEYIIKGRGGKGSRTAKISKKSGPLAGLAIVSGDEDIMLTTNKGVMIRISVKDVSQTNRVTLGVHLIRMNDKSIVSSVAKINNEDDTSDNDK